MPNLGLELVTARRAIERDRERGENPLKALETVGGPLAGLIRPLRAKKEGRRR